MVIVRLIAQYVTEGLNDPDRSPTCTPVVHLH